MAENLSREQILATLAENQKRREGMAARVAALEARLTPAAPPGTVEPVAPVPIAPRAPEPVAPPAAPIPEPVAPVSPAPRAPEPVPVAGGGTSPEPVRPPEPAPAAPPAPDKGTTTEIGKLRGETNQIIDRLYELRNEIYDFDDFLNATVGADWSIKNEFAEATKAGFTILDACEYAEQQNIDHITTAAELTTVKTNLSAQENKAQKAIEVIRAKRAEIEKGAPLTGKTGEGTPSSGATPEGATIETKTQAQARLEKLRKEYLKAKNYYEKFQGVKGFLDRLIAQRQTATRKDEKGCKIKITKADGSEMTKLEAAEEGLLKAYAAYEKAQTEYKAAHITEYVANELRDTDSIVEGERKKREDNKLLNIQDYWKKTGLIRGAASLALLGAGFYFGTTETNTIRRGLGGAGAGFGLYDVWNAIVQLWREHFGKLRELKPEKIAKMKTLKEVAAYLAAYEIDDATKRPTAGKKDSENLAAARKGIALQDDIRYIKLRERYSELEEEIAMKRKQAIDELLDDMDEEADDDIEDIREQARGKEKWKRRGLAAAGIAASGAVGFLLGTGAIQAALGLGGEVYAKVKEAAEGYDWGTKQGVQTAKIIKHLQETSKVARDALTEQVAQAAIKTQTELAAAGASPDTITEAVGNASDQAKLAAKEAWKQSMEAARNAAVTHMEQGGGSPDDIASAAYDASLENIDKAKSAAQTAVDSKVGDIIAEGQKAAEAEKAAAAAREAALAAAKKGAGGAASAAQQAQEAADTSFKALSKADQMKDIYRAALAAQAKPEVSDAAIKDIAQERVDNDEFKKLGDAIAATKQEYLTRIATTHADELSNLASQIDTKGKLTINELENLRNLASWHDTTVGDTAHKLLLYVENPDHHVLQTSEIETVEITKDKPLFEAFSEAEHKLGITDAATIDKNFATLLEHYGVDAINEKGAINADTLKAAKDNIKHAGETLWYSKDGDFIASQELDMMQDELEPSEIGQPVAAAEVPEKQAPKAQVADQPTGKKAEQPAAKAPAKAPDARAVTSGATGDIAARPAASGSIEIKFEEPVGGETTGLPKGWEWLSNSESLKNLPFDQIQKSPEIFYQHVVAPLKAYYPGLSAEVLDQKLFDQEGIAKLIRDPQHGKENIRQLFSAFMADEKSKITLHTAGEEKPITIEPRKK